MRLRTRLAVSLFLPALLLPTLASAQLTHRHQSDFPPEEFAARRAEVFEAIGDNAIVLLQGAANVQGFHVFRQSNEFYYLTGLAVPHSYLLMDGRNQRTYLFLPHRNEGRERGEGKTLAAEDADLVTQLTGVDDVQGVHLLSNRLWRYLIRTPYPTLYTMLSPAEGAAQSRDEILIGFGEAVADPWDNRPTRTGAFVEQIGRLYPQFEIADLTPILDQMRVVKSPREVDLIRKSTRLAALGILEAMRSTQPGMYEYHLDAAANYVYKAGGAQGEAYRSITATGTNAYFGHYYRNDALLEDGQLILMDYAPDYRYYTSDVTRMWPVNGKFNDSQRELYSWIVEYYDELQKHIRPGVTSDQIMDETAAIMKPRFEARTWSKPSYEQAARETLTFRGHLSHPVGLAVHDVGTYRLGPLEPGTVFSIDPMMWVRDERLYVRLEDVGVVTEDGWENFSAFAPTTIDDIEALMREEGVLETTPPVSLDDGDPEGICSSNVDCAASDYCHFEVGTCGGSGTCEERPAMCTMDYTPVCGCDGETYANACGAAGAGVNVRTEGECG
jgi:Xaa-Pro aminopeptidase